MIFAFKPVIFFFTIVLVCFMMFQSFSLRTFLASVFGMLTPWILYLSIVIMVQPDYNLSKAFNINIISDLNINQFPLSELIYTSLMGIIGIIGIVGMYSITNSDAINTRNKLNFLLFLLISLLILSFIFRNQFISFLPLIALVYAMLMSHPLTLKQNNFYGIVFLVFCIINIAFVISKYFSI